MKNISLNPKLIWYAPKRRSHGHKSIY